MAEAANLEEAVGGGSDANSFILSATPSFSSTLSSSDLDTESTTSFFPERSITLGSLIGIARSASTMEDDDPSSCPRSSNASHVSHIRSTAKLWSLLPCGTCVGICYADKGLCKGFCCANKSNGCIVSSATGPSSLGHFLTAERDTERSIGRDMERSSSNDAKVYINIMYEESAGTSQRLEEAAVNPLYDPDFTPARRRGNMPSMGSTVTRCMRSERALVEAGMMPSLHVDDDENALMQVSTEGESESASVEAGMMPSLHVDDDENALMQVSTEGETTSMVPYVVEVAPCHTPSLPVKGHKTPFNNPCALGCLSHKWARYRV